MTNDFSDIEIPEGWSLSTVEESFFDIRNGTTATQNKQGRGVPVSRIETLQLGRFDLTRVQHIADAPDELIEKFRYRYGDIALSHINSFDHVGKTALYTGCPEFFLHGMNLLRLRLGHSHIVPRFIHLFMQTDIFRDEVRHRAGQAVNQVSINQTNLGAITIPLAPVAEQERIVAKVEALLARVNAARQRLCKVPAILKRLRQSVLTAACSGRLTADWRQRNKPGSGENLIAQIAHSRTTDQKAAQNSLERRIDGLDQFPATWELTTIGFLAEPTMHQRPYITSGSRGWAEFVSPKGPYFIRSENINTDYLRLDDAIRVNPPPGPEAERTRVCAQDLLLTITGNNVGRTAIVPNNCPAAHVSQHVAIIRATKVSDVRFLWIWLRSIEHGQKQLQGYFYGYTKPGLNLEQVKNVRVALPPLAEQHEILRRVGALFRLADAIERRVAAATARAEKLTQAILAKAFRGELVPTEAELARNEGRDYEPASALLERIRAARGNQGDGRTRKPKRIRS